MLEQYLMLALYNGMDSRLVLHLSRMKPLLAFVPNDSSQFLSNDTSLPASTMGTTLDRGSTLPPCQIHLLFLQISYLQYTWHAFPF